MLSFTVSLNCPLTTYNFKDVTCHRENDFCSPITPSFSNIFYLLFPSPMWLTSIPETRILNHDWFVSNVKFIIFLMSHDFQYISQYIYTVLSSVCVLKPPHSFRIKLFPSARFPSILATHILATWTPRPHVHAPWTWTELARSSGACRSLLPLESSALLCSWCSWAGTLLREQISTSL